MYPGPTDEVFTPSLLKKNVRWTLDHPGTGRKNVPANELRSFLITEVRSMIEMLFVPSERALGRHGQPAARTERRGAWQLRIFAQTEPDGRRACTCGIARHMYRVHADGNPLDALVYDRSGDRRHARSPRLASALSPVIPASSKMRRWRCRFLFFSASGWCC